MADTKLDLEKAKHVAQTVIGDVATMLHGALCYIGDRLGLFKAMAAAGPVTVAQLAARSGQSERYIREWLGSMAAAHYVEYDPADRHLYCCRPSMPPPSPTRIRRSSSAAISRWRRPPLRSRPKSPRLLLPARV